MPAIIPSEQGKSRCFSIIRRYQVTSYNQFYYASLVILVCVCTYQIRRSISVLEQRGRVLKLAVSANIAGTVGRDTGPEKDGHSSQI